GAPRVVEREQDRRERGRCRAAARARGMRREATAVAVVERDGNALALAEGRADRVGESPPIRVRRWQAVHDHEDFVSLPHPLLRVGRVETGHDAVELCPHEPRRAELWRYFYVWPVRARW